MIAGEFGGELSVEGRWFPSAALFPEQGNGGGSFALQPEFRWRLPDGSRELSLVPFYRWDSMDTERTHFDVREALLRQSWGQWDLYAGLGQVFWGVAESNHLIDVINQTDSVEGPFTEEKLGQPMVRVARRLGSGKLDLFALPYFRQRTLVGTRGRYRFLIPFDNGEAGYESSDEQRHFDWSLRWSQTAGPVDWGIYWFQGTARVPEFQPEQQGNSLKLLPYYPLIGQIGLDLQLTSGAWLWKLEALHRDGGLQDYSAAIGGFEYSLDEIQWWAGDVGLLAEYNYDSRESKTVVPIGLQEIALEDVDAGNQIPLTSVLNTFGLPSRFSFVPWQNDLFLGTRLEFNDAGGTRALGGIFWDLEYRSWLVRLEASRRIGNDLRVSLNALVPGYIAEEDPLSSFRKDDMIQLEAKYFF
ncbi:MAG: hypothetical protein LJE70_18045 [Chromatiaceae bacterium]|nr:hypothetical protein [Chromatiaceae bacterium]